MKTYKRASLAENRLNSLLRICIEGPDMNDFSPGKAIDIWARSSVTPRRLTRNPSGDYTSSAKNSRGETLIDMSDEE